MSNVAESNLKRLAKQVGFPLTGYYSNDGGDTFAVTFNDDSGEAQTKIINKQNLSESFRAAKATVAVSDNATYSEVYKAFSDKYALGLVEGVDYVANDKPVVINQIAIITLVISHNSILYAGSVTITAYKKSSVEKFQNAANKLGKAVKRALAQMGLAVTRPFEPTSEAFVGNQVTPATVKAIKDRFKDNDFFDNVMFADIAAGTIIRYQGWTKKDTEQTVVKVYLRGLSGQLYSFSVIPQSDADRPTKN